MAAGVVQDRGAQRLQLQRRQHRAHIAKGFMERGRFMARRTPKLRLYRVQYGVAHFVTDNVRALARIHGARWCRAMKEIQRPPVVIGVQVDTLVEQHRQARSQLPIPRRHSRRPEIGAAAQRLGSRPVSEARGSGLAAWRRRSARKVICERALGWVGEWPRYLNTGFRIVFPDGHLLSGRGDGITSGCGTAWSRRARHLLPPRLVIDFYLTA